MTSVPPTLLGFSYADVCNQRVAWKPTDPWRQALTEHRQLLEALTNEAIEHGGIRRSFVHERAIGDSVELFLAMMAWGLGRRVRGRYTRYQWNLLAGPAAVYSNPATQRKICRIVEATQRQGAAAGWHSLLVTQKIRGFEMYFGTKLLYFAGYSLVAEGPKPLIMDTNVRNGLARLRPDMLSPHGGRQVSRVEYVGYLEQAAAWASEAHWNQSPDTVEYGLFRLGQAQ